ncbi:MAG TPA: tripartite tricarboxylate transporter substrate binding protein [Burkholderiales bacterium]|nr:tripartite tricarboxylate transporter substrate binding protein [Burkholderiales bacterium]
MNTSWMAAVASSLAIVSLPATAQVYPDKPIRVIVPVPAGGTPEVVARLVTPGLSTVLGQQLVVDNRGGAGGLIGAELAARATPDGYTLFLSSPGPLTILPHLQQHIAYDPVRDFVPIGLISVGPFLLLVHPSVPATSVKELLALARAQPGRINYASAGNGSANHLATELFKSMAGVNITHVPYKGAPQAVTDLIGGQVQMMFNSIAPMLPHIKAERVRLLAIATAKRSPQMPDVPTVSEAGVPGYEAISWFGLMAPAKTPQAILTKLNAALVKVVHDPETRRKFETLGADPVGSSPAEFAALIRRESEKYAKVVKTSGAKVD